MQRNHTLKHDSLQLREKFDMENYLRRPHYRKMCWGKSLLIPKTVRSTSTMFWMENFSSWPYFLNHKNYSLQKSWRANWEPALHRDTTTASSHYIYCSIAVLPNLITLPDLLGQQFQQILSSTDVAKSIKCWNWQNSKVILPEISNRLAKWLLESWKLYIYFSIFTWLSNEALFEHSGM